ncbi:MAG: VWA domain-containing protein, partial [Hyphomicrobiales bacterium]|nr:VWA domain-containing protein [Hyphomicrobiales bacterium]
AGGSVEHWNEEPGAVWLKRLLAQFERVAWLNPVRREEWDYTWSTAAIRQLFGDRMYPLTLDGLEQAMQALAR